MKELRDLLDDIEWFLDCPSHESLMNHDKALRDMLRGLVAHVNASEQAIMGMFEVQKKLVDEVVYLRQNSLDPQTKNLLQKGYIA